MLTTFLVLWMSAQTGDFKVSTIDNINDFCASSAQCFPVLIDPSAEAYGPLKGTPDKGKIACEVKKDHTRCINAFGATVTLNFNDPGEAAYSQEFAEAAQRAADETDGKPPKCANGSNCYCGDTGCRDYTQAEWDEFNRIMAEPVEPVKPPEPMDVPAVQAAGHISDADRRWCIDGAPLDSAVSCPNHAIWTCADKSRVLLRSENGTAHCIKFPEAK